MNSRENSPQRQAKKKTVGLNAAQAEQIALLLNESNNLRLKYDGLRVMSSRAVYYPLHYYNLVFGSVALYRINFMLTEVKHLVIHPKFRRMGLAESLLSTVIPLVKTPLMFATIREANKASMNLFIKKGFKRIASVPVDDHRTALLMRAGNVRKSRSLLRS